MTGERADKWLWATRFFKTRSLAAKTCSLEKIKRTGHFIKPATTIHEGDVLGIPFPEGPGVRTILVKTLISLRVGAPQAQVCYEDQTPPEVYAENKQALIEKRDAGGRPTKRDRRVIGKIHGFWD